MTIYSCGTSYRLSVSGAIEGTKEIRTAESDNMQSEGRYVGLAELAQKGLISKRISDGEEWGYKFVLQTDGSKYQLNTNPIDEKNPEKLPFFYLDETGVIRSSNRLSIALPNDPAIGNQ